MTAPALLVAIPLLLGVLLGAWLTPPRIAIAPPLVLAWCACAIATWRRPPRFAITATIAGACAGSTLAGVLLGAAAQRAADRPSLLAWYATLPADRTAHLTGTLRDDAANTGTAVTLTLDVIDADGHHVDGGVRATVA